MSPKVRKPRWWQLYAMLPVLAVLFVFEIRLGLPGSLNIIAQLGILVLVYGFVRLWLRDNRRALLDADADAGEWRIRVYHIPPKELPRAEWPAKTVGDRPILQLPDAGLKGVLSTTFEVDEFEEASAFPAGSEILFSEDVLNVEDSKQAGH